MSAHSPITADHAQTVLAAMQYAIMRKSIADQRRALRLDDDDVLNAMEAAQLDAERCLADALDAAGLSAAQLRGVL